MQALQPQAALDGTRSGHRWSEVPGSWDPLNTRAVFPSFNRWGIPDLPAAEWEPTALVAYSSRSACATAAPGAAVHYFLDDYRFEVLWNRPEQSLSRIRSVGASLTPDFSLWRDMPMAMQLWQVYRARWCGAWLLHHGVAVIPTVGWSTAASLQFAFAGIARGSTVAVSTVGARDRVARQLFAAGYRAMCAQVQPQLVLCYGAPPPSPALAALAPVRYYPTRWDRPAATLQGSIDDSHHGR